MCQISVIGHNVAQSLDYCRVRSIRWTFVYGWYMVLVMLFTSRVVRTPTYRFDTNCGNVSVASLDGRPLSARQCSVRILDSAAQLSFAVDITLACLLYRLISPTRNWHRCFLLDRGLKMSISTYSKEHCGKKSLRCPYL